MRIRKIRRTSYTDTDFLGTGYGYAKYRIFWYTVNCYDLVEKKE